MNPGLGSRPRRCTPLPSAARTAVLALVCLGACDAGPPVAVIGVAVGASARENVRVARDELTELPAGEVDVRIVFDSARSNAAPDLDVVRAEALLAEEGLVAVVGHPGSRGSLAAAPMYNEAGVTQLVPNGTSRLLADAGPWTLSLAPNDSIEGAFIARFAVSRLGAQSVVIFYTNDEFGVGLRDGVAEGMAAVGASVLDRVPIRAEADLEVLVAQSLLRGTPDVVVLATGGPESTALVSRLWNAGYRGAFIAGDGSSLVMLREAGAGADSTYAVGFWYPGRPTPQSREYHDRFQRVTGSVPTWSDAMRHDALMVVAAAIREAGTGRAAIRQYLDELGRSRPPYPGVTGPVSFTPDRSYGLVMLRAMSGAPVAEWARP